MLKRRLFRLVVWGIAFGYIEASIVVYLRKIYYPAGFSFPVVLLEADIAAVEMIRVAWDRTFRLHHSVSVGFAVTGTSSGFCPYTCSSAWPPVWKNSLSARWELFTDFLSPRLSSHTAHR
ncbi:MAG TPA: hypothetical protein ENH32_09455 [Proteobacteria bacterium]|nr:hypothetical protein [Pseudomonadota bacterium]